MRSPRLVGVHRLHHRKGGAEGVHLDHLALFRERGWSCAEFAMDHPDNEPSDWQPYFPARFEPAAGLAGIRQVPRLFHSSEARAKFARLLDEVRPDVIHMHGIYAHLTNAILKPALERRIPIVYTLHDYKLVCPAYHFWTERNGVCEKCHGGRQWRCLTERCTGGGLAKDALYALDGLVQWHTGQPRRAIDRFVGPCRFIVDKFVAHGFEPERMRFVPNFFESTDDAAVDPAQVAQLRTRHGRHLLYFGRLSPEKGLDHLIAAAASADVPLVLVGEGPHRATLERLAASSGARVAFLGHLKGAALWAQVEAASAVALPSVWYEIAPKSILEAQARGKPALVTAIGGLPEMVEDGVSGLVVPPHDRAALAEGVRRLFAMSDTALAALGAQARARALADYTRERYYREMVAIYRELVPGLAA